MIMGDTAFLPRSKKNISPGHVVDTAFLPRQKPISQHSEHSAVLPSILHTISNMQACQKEKCRINRLWYGNLGRRADMGVSG